MSQWSTLESGPLARVQSPEKGRKLGEWQKLRSQAESLTSEGLSFYTDKVTNQAT